MNVNLWIAIDLGASLTKTFYRFQTGPDLMEGYRTFCSAVQPITASIYELRRYVDDNTSVIAFEDSYWMVGNAAKQEVTITDARKPKAHHAIAKVLAMVGQVVSEMASHEPVSEIQIELGVLLPLDEMEGDAELAEKLAELLYGFGHNGNRIECGLVRKIHVSPEGYGISRIAKKSPSGVLMFGHRDVSWIHIDEGSISIADSKALPGRGMHKLVGMLSLPSKDSMNAARLVFAAGEALADKALLKLVEAEDLGRLKVQLREARILVWQQLMDELSGSTIRSVEQVICSGGNAYYWRSELRVYLGSRLCWGPELLIEMQEKFEGLVKSPLLYRLADCYGFWRSMTDAVSSPVRQVSAVLTGRDA